MDDLLSKPQMIVHLEHSIPYTVYDTYWIPCSPRLVSLGCHPNGKGALEVLELRGQKLQSLENLFSSSPLKCGSFKSTSQPDRLLVTGDFSGGVKLWDLEAGTAVWDAKRAHEEIVNAVDGLHSSSRSEIYSGSRDGNVKVWDRRIDPLQGPVVVMEPEDGEARRDCWSVTCGHAFSEEDRCIAAGFDNGDLKLFDLRALSLRWETHLKNGICSLEFDRRTIFMNKLVASTLEGKIHVFDCRTVNPDGSFTSLCQSLPGSSPRATVWLARHSPFDREVLMTSGGSNGSLQLWKYVYPAEGRTRKDESTGKEFGVTGELVLLQKAVVASQPVTGFDWHPDKMGLAVASSLDQALRLILVTKLKSI
ncbi:unnamed protein product [Cyprideis torosa]|uniref:WD repeat-containing protein 92 n=1 Tax=Cyprideis torosa TaxID=163714 RepID=A0A7R8WUT1_9CRUS|nr:unnamed protein product [Cyprideis torosa]CAG0905944.1 unnamed protein product [Cyprideis torosa]